MTRFIFALAVIAVIVAVESIAIRMFLKLRDVVRRSLSRRRLRAHRTPVVPSQEVQKREPYMDHNETVIRRNHV